MFKDEELNEKYPTLSKFSAPVQKAEREIVGRDYEVSQLMAAMARPELCNALLLAPPGSGKALENGTPIPVNDKRVYVPIEKLVAGQDEVFDEEGLPQPVDGVFPQGKLAAYRVNFDDGSSMVCNDEHLWNARRGDRSTDLVAAHKAAATDMRHTNSLDNLLSLMSATRDLWAAHETLTLREMIDGAEGNDWFIPAGRGVERGVQLSDFEDHLRTEQHNHTVPQALREAVMLNLKDRQVFAQRVGRPDRATGWSFLHDGDIAVNLRRLLASSGIRTDSGRFTDAHGDGIRIRPRRDHVAELRIVSVEDLGVEREMTCIKVGGKSELFQAGLDHIVTHNTALVQLCMLRDTNRTYMEVDLAKMISGLASPDEMAALIKQLFDEAEDYSKTEHAELVLFIDEFHQVVQLSAASVEALKPVLAASGARGIRVIAATTDEEFDKYIKPNQPLVERLQRIIVNPPDKATTISIMKGMAKRYGVADSFWDDHLFEQIHEYTERYMPAATQPRKSILVLDSMVGWHVSTGRPIDRNLLADVLMESLGVNVAFRVDAEQIKADLDKKVFSQHWATSVVAKRLQLCVADLHDKSKPASSFLLAGSTGVGKLCVDSTRVPVETEDGSVAWKRHGDLIPGDRVFQRDGSPQDVLGFFPQGVQDVYRVTLWDGRTLDVGGPHLWGVYTSKMRSNMHAGKTVEPRVMTTLEMLETGVVRSYPGDTREHLKFFIPANGAVQWPAQDLAVDPYALGALIGNGCLTLPPLTLSSDDAYTVLRVGEALGSVPKPSHASTYSWVFPTGEKWGRGDKLIQTRDVLAEVPDLVGAYSGERRIPAQYLTASIEQRWELVRGLFDTDGTIDASTGRFNVSYSTFSEGLAEDVRELLFSLGVSNSLQVHTRTKEDGRELVEYDVHVKVGNDDKAQFFALPRKREIAEAAAESTAGRDRVKRFDTVGIKSIEKLPEQESSSCIYVSGDEHLYQAGQFVVTHNTELTKQLAMLLFGDVQKHLIRFDMTEFARDESLDAFRTELTSKVWHTSHAVILFDEIEKASPMVTRVLLQVLDDGRLSDANGRQVSFLNSYIVLTTNSGSEIFETMAQYNVDDTGSGVEMQGRMKEIRRAITTTQGENRFPPELLGRIDAIVPFQPLSRKTQEQIIIEKLRRFRQEVMTKHGVKLMVDPKVVEYLVEDKGDSDSNAGGARASIAKLTDEVGTKVAAFINKHPGQPALQVDIVGDMKSGNKDILKSYAEVVVALPKS